jgi:hypothetical protein
MEFLKKHYEKLILSVVLLGLAAVAATLPMKVNQEKQREEERKTSLLSPKVNPFPPVDLSTNKAILEKVKAPIHFDIAGKHNLFNPVPWVERPNGELVKVQGNVGIDALQVTAIHPLHMVVSFDEVIPTSGPNNTTEYKYQVTVIREGAAHDAKQSRAMSVGLTAGGIGTLKDLQGADPANPAGLVLVLPDRTQVTITKDKPFSKIIAYAADLNCSLPPLDKKMAKEGDPLILGTDVYNVRVVDENSVTLQDKRTQKQFTKKVESAK